MGGSKKPVATQTPFQQATTYSQITPTETPDTQALRDFKVQADPTVPYQQAAAHARLDSSFNNPLGANTTQAVREATQRAASENIDQATGQQMNQSYADQQGLKLGQLSGLASLTAPRLVSSGQSGYNTQLTAPQPSTFDSILGAAAGVGSAALM